MKVGMQRSMKGKIYMNQVQIKVLLTVIGETDVLTFFLDEDKYPDGITVNLNSSDGQNDLKRVFSALLEKLELSKIELSLDVAEGYSKGLYKDVSDEYIRSLNDELSTVYHKIQEELCR